MSHECTHLGLLILLGNLHNLDAHARLEQRRDAVNGHILYCLKNSYNALDIDCLHLYRPLLLLSHVVDNPRCPLHWGGMEVRVYGHRLPSGPPHVPFSTLYIREAAGRLGGVVCLAT
jgi:hypothetical protein